MKNAIKSIIFAPVVGLVIAVFFYATAKVLVILRPMGNTGPFASIFGLIDVSLSIIYNLIQLASSIETWIAIVVIVFGAYGLFAPLVSNGDFGSR